LPSERWRWGRTRGWPTVSIIPRRLLFKVDRPPRGGGTPPGGVPPDPFGSRQRRFFKKNVLCFLFMTPVFGSPGTLPPPGVPPTPLGWVSAEPPRVLKRSLIPRGWTPPTTSRPIPPTRPRPAHRGTCWAAVSPARVFSSSPLLRPLFLSRNHLTERPRCPNITLSFVA